jgi:hypothetical protein
LETYSDVAAKNVNPLYHYIVYGASEGRDPDPTFSTRGYLNAYPDVREKGMNPLYHYLYFGAIEGRK